MVNALARDLHDLSAIGADPEGGITRIAWSAELMAAYAAFAERGRTVGATADVDAAGNAFLRWSAGGAAGARGGVAGARGGAAGARGAAGAAPVGGAGGATPAFLIGSHLDTVPRGGAYDGALGVLAGLDVLRSFQARGSDPGCPVWVTAFMDEEGTRFGTALFGSRAFAGHDLSGLGSRADRAGITIAEAMAACGYDHANVGSAARIDGIRGYLELHIEQGPVLEQSGEDIGVVTSIVGLLGLQVRLEGQANHAGTTPMGLRRDALAGAARAVLELRDLARRTPAVTANVGTITVEPGGKNVIPGACDFSVDIRAADHATYLTLDEAARGILARIANEESLALTITEIYRLEPVPMATAFVDALERAAELEGASCRRLPSGAGHDAQIIAPHVPAAMLFVPSRGGISHNPAEYTTPEQCALGSRVLARAVMLLAGA